MKLIIPAFIVSTFMGSCFAVKVQMPAADVLQARFKNLGLTEFYEKTSIKNLADQTLELSRVRASFCVAFIKYATVVPGGEVLLRKMKPEIMRALLHDSPEGIQELQELGII